MHLLQSGVDITVIALWLGHEDTATTHIYLEADLAMKKAALKRLHEPALKPLTYKAPDRLLAFLEALRLCAPQSRRPAHHPGSTVTFCA
jgi:integrase/recombinase XerD